jgi:hypothetical protein
MAKFIKLQRNMTHGLLQEIRILRITENFQNIISEELSFLR